MGDIQLDLLFFINNRLQNPFLDMMVPPYIQSLM